jgi:hypothetical protein
VNVNTCQALGEITNCNSCDISFLQQHNRQDSMSTVIQLQCFSVMRIVIGNCDE